VADTSAARGSAASPAVSTFTEQDLIARVQRALPPPPAWLLVGIGDDAAVVEPERNRVEVLSVDALVEGVHFDRAFVPADATGYRALAVNLSDLAAMGAEPRLALLSMAVPGDWLIDQFDGVIAGLTRLAAEYRIHVAGGNLTRSPGPFMIDITVLGTVKRRQALTRAGARPGDDIYVSGTVGTAAAGLGMLRASLLNKKDTTDQNACINRYLYPEPRVRLGLLLSRTRVATAAIDLSDGLADAVYRIADASGVGAMVDAGVLPLDAGARGWFSQRGADPITEAIAGGDDYELLFTARPRSEGRLAAARRHGQVPLTRIGVCTDRSRGVRIRHGETERELPRAGYDHFR
jgi:thiamine-monophosphate kinase